MDALKLYFAGEESKSELADDDWTEVFNSPKDCNKQHIEPLDENLTDINEETKLAQLEGKTW